MFLLLTFVCLLHQTYVTLYAKTDKYPLFHIPARFIETIGRLTIFPIVTALYVSRINEISEGFDVAMIAIVTIICVYVFIQEVRGIVIIVKSTLLLLLAKINHPGMTIQELSIIEIRVFNFWKYREFSSSTYRIENELAKNENVTLPTKEDDEKQMSVEIDQQDSMELHRVVSHRGIKRIVSLKPGDILNPINRRITGNNSTEMSTFSARESENSGYSSGSAM